MKKFCIGIAGYSGSGKSIISTILNAAGFQVIDADSAAKEFLLSHPEICARLKIHYPACLNHDTTINFKALAQQVFTSRETLIAYNALVHPPLCIYFKKMLLKNTGLCAFDAALIPLWNMESVFQACVWVSAPGALRCQRIAQRTGLSEHNAMKRLALQESLFPEPTGAPYKVLDNQSSESDFTGRVHAWIASLGIFEEASQ